jgi:hypothetical protein
MNIKSVYEKRSIRFLEIYQYKQWQIKVYSISIHAEYISEKNFETAKQNLGEWLKNVNKHEFETYNIATLILHEGREGCFAIINWWVDENMLQNFVYLLTNDSEEYKLFSDTGIITCVWEMAVLWHERNAWVKHVLQKNENPDYHGYLHDQLNQDL